VRDRSVVPDISVVERDNIPVDEQGEVVATGIDFAPHWAIEI